MASFTLNRDLKRLRIPPFEWEITAGEIYYCPDDMFEELRQHVEANPVYQVTGPIELDRDINLSVSTHGILSNYHTVSGLTAGQPLRATSATAFDFGQIGGSAISQVFASTISGVIGVSNITTGTNSASIALGSHTHAASGTTLTVKEIDGSPSTTVDTLVYPNGSVSVSGSTATVRASMSGVYDVTAYGALGDGSNDDTAEIQAAIDACMNAGGGIVYFPDPSAYYRVSATIDIDPVSASSPIRLVGGGGGQYVLGPCIRMVTTNTTLFHVTTNATGTVFEHLFLYQATGSQTSGDGIDADNDVFLTDVQINGFYNGLHLNSISYYSKHVNCTFTQAAGAAVLIDAGANNADFYGCRVQSSEFGYNIGGSLKVGVFGGSIEANSTAGIIANGGATNGAGLHISGVYFEQGDGATDISLGTTSAIYAVNIDGCAFIKSNLSGTGWHIDATNAVGLTVTGCEFHSSSAVRASSPSTNVTLIGNRNRNGGTYTLPSGSVVVESGAISFSEQTAGTPSSGFVRLYAKSDGNMYQKDDAGTETALVAAAGTITVSEIDGSPSSSGISNLVFSNGAITISGGTATVAISAGTSSATSAFIGCVAQRTTDQTGVANTTGTNISFTGTDLLDTDGFHDPASNADRITIPAGRAGKYRFTAHIIWDTNNTGMRQLAISKNASSTLVATSHAASTSGEYTYQTTVTAPTDMAEGDYVTASVYHNSGGNRTLIGSAVSLKFAAEYLGS